MTVADVPAGLAAAADASLRWHPGGPFDLMQTIGTVLRGHGDPSIRTAPDGVWLAFTTPHGPATLRLATAGPRADPAVDAQAWGPGAVDAVDSVPRMLGSEDDWSGFDDPAFHATLPRMMVAERCGPTPALCHSQDGMRSHCAAVGWTSRLAGATAPAPGAAVPKRYIR